MSPVSGWFGWRSADGSWPLRVLMGDTRAFGKAAAKDLGWAVQAIVIRFSRTWHSQCQYVEPELTLAGVK